MDVLADPVVGIVTLIVIGVVAWYTNRVWTKPQKPPSGDHWVRPVQLPPDEG